jgi:hypothetical protein
MGVFVKKAHNNILNKTFCKEDLLSHLAILFECSKTDQIKAISVDGVSNFCTQRQGYQSNAYIYIQ